MSFRREAAPCLLKPCNAFPQRRRSLKTTARSYSLLNSLNPIFFCTQFCAPEILKTGIQGEKCGLLRKSPGFHIRISAFPYWICHHINSVIAVISTSGKRRGDPFVLSVTWKKYFLNHLTKLLREAKMKTFEIL